MTYRITNWAELFETDETRKRDALRWVPVPNKHDGLGFRTVAAQRNAAELYAAWHLMLQVASKAKRGERGVLARAGHPLTAEDMAIMTGFPRDGFERALVFFSHPKLNWITVDPDPEVPAGSAVGDALIRVTSVPAAPSAAAPADDAALPADDAGVTARREEKGIEGKGSAHAPPAPEIPTETEVIAFGSGSMIPEAYCRRYHAKTSETYGWLTVHGRLIDWRKRLRRYWEQDGRDWTARQNGGSTEPPRVPVKRLPTAAELYPGFVDTSE